MGFFLSYHCFLCAKLRWIPGVSQSSLHQSVHWVRNCTPSGRAVLACSGICAAAVALCRRLALLITCRQEGPSSGTDLHQYLT